MTMDMVSPVTGLARLDTDVPASTPPPPLAAAVWGAAAHAHLPDVSWPAGAHSPPPHPGCPPAAAQGRTWQAPLQEPGTTPLLLAWSALPAWPPASSWTAQAAAACPMPSPASSTRQLLTPTGWRIIPVSASSICMRLLSCPEGAGVARRATQQHTHAPPLPPRGWLCPAA